jgi:hypothetical protein
LRSADTHLDALAGQIAGANERERAMYVALRLWRANDNLRAVEAMEAVTEKWPTDLFTAKLAEFLYYVLGQQHMGARFRAHMGRIEYANADDPDFLGMAAFASELCGDFADAERRATHSLELEVRNPWAQHALSHVLLRQGRVREGMQELRAFLPQLATCARPIHSHDAWHLALLHLEELDIPNALAIADHVAPPTTETFIPFMNAHYAYALARAGREEAVQACLSAVRERSQAGDAEALRVWVPAGRSIVEACARFGSGDQAGAAAIFEPVMADMTRIGGSDAQDDLFRQTFLRSLQAAGRKSDATSYFDRISGEKRRTPLDHALAAS